MHNDMGEKKVRRGEAIMNSLKALSNHLLVEAYLKAKKLNLEQEFCQLIKQEMNNRGLLDKHLEMLNKKL